MSKFFFALAMFFAVTLGGNAEARGHGGGHASHGGLSTHAAAIGGGTDQAAPSVGAMSGEVPWLFVAMKVWVWGFVAVVSIWFLWVLAAATYSWFEEKRKRV